ncbi:MAG: alpha/beta fold hydrolase [Burkholderiaceae bacterium]
MPFASINTQLSMHFQVDDFTDPWTQSEVILLLHGNAESGDAWFAWVPSMSRHFRVVRPDMRGFGASTPMPKDHNWSLDELVCDFVTLMDHLKTKRFHLVGAKLGGTIARRLAGEFPERVLSLTLVGTPAADRGDLSARTTLWNKEFEELGIRRWATESMDKRLGSDFPKNGVRWWIELMCKTPIESQIGFMKTIPSSNVEADLPNIKCPTLVMSTELSALGKEEDIAQWQAQILNSELQILKGDSYHAAASHADECASRTIDFIHRHRTLAYEIECSLLRDKT